MASSMKSLDEKLDKVLERLLSIEGRLTIIETTGKVVAWFVGILVTVSLAAVALV